MSTEVTVKVNEYGIKEETAKEFVNGLAVAKSERELLIAEFNTVSKLEVTTETVPQFKALRLSIMRNRTQGFEKWRVTNKAYFLRGGQFIDATYNKEELINLEMESALLKGEKHFENLEKERLESLQNKRAELLSKYLEDASERDLTKFEDDEFEAFLQLKKKQFEDKIEAERLDSERIENERIAKEKAIEDQRLENERLKKLAEEKEAQLQKERKEAQAKADAIEAKAKLEREKALAEAEELRKQQAIKDAKIKAENDAKLKAEQESKAKLEAELKAVKDAEFKALKDAKLNEEVERLKAIKNAKAPIKTKLNNWVSSFELPNTDVDNETSKEIIAKFEAFKKWATSQVTSL